MSDPYKILGLSSKASEAEIKRAYRELAKHYHPDVSKSAEASRRMQEINEAYGILGDPDRRAEYDQMQQMAAAQTAQAAQTDRHSHVCCSRCGKVDSSLRVSTFTTVWSFVLFSFHKSWAYIFCARCRVLASLRFNCQVLVFGWWGFPWGVIWSIKFLLRNASGGHQPPDNNATLLAFVGRNLIQLGDYLEAEKALIASLQLRRDPAVLQLLQVAKSKVGYPRATSFLQRILGLESHPAFYNTALISLFAGIVGCLMQANSGATTSSTASYAPPTAYHPPPAYTYQPPPPKRTLPTIPALDMPGNGTWWDYAHRPIIAPLTITTNTNDYTTNYFVKLVDWNTGEAVCAFFVCAGQSISVKVPLGNYRIKYASGTTWYGSNYLFGSDTAYSQADDCFSFTVQGETVNGYTLTLYKVRDGNLRLTPIKESDF